MSGKSRERFAWADLARQSAEAAGFRPARWRLAAGSFGLARQVSAYVRVGFQRVTNVNVAPEVFVGMYTEEFELEWSDRLTRTSLPPEFEEAPPLSLHALNIDRLCPRPWPANSPSDQDVAEVRDYLDRAFEYARGFPSGVDDLAAAIHSDRLGEHSVEAYLGHPVKVRGFVQWLHRRHGIDVGERVLPLLTDRTGQYDVRAMLAEG